MGESVADSFNRVMQNLGLETLLQNNVFPAVCSDASQFYSDTFFSVNCPIDSSPLANVTNAEVELAVSAVHAAKQAHIQWRAVPAPKRAELVRYLAQEVRKNKESLSLLITLECGKTIAESRGEVQEMIDICDFAVGLSRQLYGLTMPSERPLHRLTEQWHPLGVVAIISAFNFPMAVWAWNAALALVCGNSIIWKPSEKTPLSALACQKLLNNILEMGTAKLGWPQNLSTVINGGAAIGQALAQNTSVSLLSATGSVAMGRSIAPVVADRLGRYLLELGGNNAMIVSASADLELAARAIAFSALGTTGQRCTTLRRLILHCDIADELINRLKAIYGSVQIGDPRDEASLMGPLIDSAAFEGMQAQMALLEQSSENVVVKGGRVCSADLPSGYYVAPAIVEVSRGCRFLRQEGFFPLLYVLRYQAFEEAIAMNNEVPQGLSSAIFTGCNAEAELFVSAQGSDCGLANVNIGTSGAEIGGAFGGDKDTGGGRESGSDAWKSYMRRSTNTINYGQDLPLAQGIKFD